MTGLGGMQQQVDTAVGVVSAFAKGTHFFFHCHLLVSCCSRGDALTTLCNIRSAAQKCGFVRNAQPGYLTLIVCEMSYGQISTFVHQYI